MTIKGMRVRTTLERQGPRPHTSSEPMATGTDVSRLLKPFARAFNSCKRALLRWEIDSAPLATMRRENFRVFLDGCGVGVDVTLLASETATIKDNKREYISFVGIVKNEGVIKSRASVRRSLHSVSHLIVYVSCRCKQISVAN
jgi:hypothetical protein